MTILEMHQLFRVIGQQMGMQTIRAILPEEIDVFLNMAINEKKNEVLASNVLSDTNKVLTGNAKIDNLNFFRTLYCYGEASITSNTEEFTIATCDLSDIMLITGCNVGYVISNKNKVYSARIVSIDKVRDTINDYCNSPSYDYPIVEFSPSLDKTNELTLQVYTKGKQATSVTILYIKYPSIVNFEENIDCDLPDYVHNEIVQLAVQKYFNAVGSTTHNVE